ncbi:MAG: hypothetical protein ABIQ59_02190, partial [Nocardioidaceae bacterium]
MVNEWFRRAPSTSPEVDLLVSSPLFDHAWYAEIAGCRDDPATAARHYLDQAGKRGAGPAPWPHPLFPPARVARALRSGAVDPLVAYLQGRRFDVSVHPLFDATGYLRSHPEAASHPSGPLGHYTE